MTDVPRVKLIMTARDAGLALGLSRQTVGKKIKSGYFKSAKRLDHRLYVVRTGEVDAIRDGNHDAYVVPDDDL